MGILPKIVYSGFTFLEDILNNIITAICNLVENPKIKLIRKSDNTNRANNMGDALEEYIKDVFAGTVDYEEGQARAVALSSTFSYLGNKTNPPDSMLKGGNAGDAIEVKKIENQTAALALNSSYPKCKLYADSQMISKACRECEQWTVRDMIYAVGVVKGDYLKSLAFVYGEDYCAEESFYHKIISDLLNIASTDISKSNWSIKNPFSAFKDIYDINNANAFNFFAIINNDKYYSFENNSRLEELIKIYSSLKVKDVKIRNPNNPHLKRNAKLITYFKESS